MPTRKSSKDASTPSAGAANDAAKSAPPGRDAPAACDVLGSTLATVSGPSLPPADAAAGLSDPSHLRLAAQKAGAQQLARAMPCNRLKASEHGLAGGHRPQAGAPVDAGIDEAGASTVQEDVASAKLGDGVPRPGINANGGGLDRVRVDSTAQPLTTNQGVPVGDNQNSLKAGLRGPTLLEDFILREKITHFDHERIPERVVHARGSAAHGVFECYEPLTEITHADLFSQAGKRTPVFVRFSTVAGERGSADTVRDTRGFAVKFYTQQGNWDLVGNNMPVFFIQDAMKFPDLIHAVKPEPHHQMPQASSAHDTFYDFISLMPESVHHLLWVMSDRGIPRSYRTMQGFGVHSYRFVDGGGQSVFVKFHWLPLAGTHSLVWDEAAKITGADPDFHRRDLWEAIEAGAYPEYELALQVFTEKEAAAFSFDILDPTKLVPEELVPLRVVGKMTLNRNPDNFFAETEQVAFCTAHVVPGIDFSNDPLLQGRIHSYLDTQISRLGGANFHELPINAPLAAVHNNQRDGMHRQAIARGRVAYEPNSLAGGCPFQAGVAGFVSYPQAVHEDKVRGKPEKFADHYSQATLFWRSQSPAEQRHIIAALRFELTRVSVPAIRQRMVSVLMNVDSALAQSVAIGLGMGLPPAQARVLPGKVQAEIKRSSALSLRARPGSGSVRGLRVALLVAVGVDGAALRAVQRALLDAQAVPRVVGRRLGAVAAGDGDGASIEIETALEAMPSVLWDALVVPGGADALATLSADVQAVEFVKEQYLHCKPMLVLGPQGATWLGEIGIDALLPDGQRDPGLIVGGRGGDDASTAAELMALFIAALAKQRHHERERELQD